MVLAKTTISREALKFAGPMVTDNLFIFCKFSLEMNLFKSSIKLLLSISFFFQENKKTNQSQGK